MGRLVSLGPGNGLVELFMIKQRLVGELFFIDIEESV